MWQESASEKFWCMSCEGGSCKNDNMMLVTDCDDTDTKFSFVNQPGNGTQIRLKGTGLCLARANVRAVRTAPCDSTTPRQRWHAGLGGFDQTKFEVRPVNKEGCVSQHHHPKDGEMLYVETCAKAHRADTGYWNLHVD